MKKQYAIPSRLWLNWHLDGRFWRGFDWGNGGAPSWDPTSMPDKRDGYWLGLNMKSVSHYTTDPHIVIAIGPTKWIAGKGLWTIYGGDAKPDFVYDK